MIMNRRDFLNFLGKGMALGAITPLLTKAKTVQYINQSKIQGISPSSKDEVILADNLKYEILISWKDKINKQKRNDRLVCHYKLHQ